MELNKQALFKVRGDIHSGEIKKVVENISVTWPLQVLVTEDDGDELWNLTEGDSVEVGPFKVGSLHCTSAGPLSLSRLSQRPVRLHGPCQNFWRPAGCMARLHACTELLVCQQPSKVVARLQHAVELTIEGCPGGLEVSSAAKGATCFLSGSLGHAVLALQHGWWPVELLACGQHTCVCRAQGWIFEAPSRVSLPTPPSSSSARGKALPLPRLSSRQLLIPAASYSTCALKFACTTG